MESMKTLGMRSFYIETCENCGREIEYGTTRVYFAQDSHFDLKPYTMDEYCISLIVGILESFVIAHRMKSPGISSVFLSISVQINGSLAS